MAGRVRQVVKQAKVRVFDGITQLPGKIVSLFEPHTEIIRKGKASKPTEFGKLVQVQETENQIITHYDVFDQRPSDRDLLLGAVEAIDASWGGRRDGWRRMLVITRTPRRRRARSGREVRIGPESWHPKRRTETTENSAGSREARSGGRDVKAGSASSSGGMAWPVAAITGSME